MKHYSRLKIGIALIHSQCVEVSSKYKIIIRRKEQQDMNFWHGYKKSVDIDIKNKDFSRDLTN